MAGKCLLLLLLLAIATGPLAAAAEPDESLHGGTLDFSRSVILTPGSLGRIESKAVAVLQEEIKKRSGIELLHVTEWPKDSTSVIAIGLESQVKEFGGPFVDELTRQPKNAAEGFTLAVKREPRRAVLLSAADGRGVLYGVGRLLRKLELSRTRIVAPAALEIHTAPAYPLRGHQLGYRPKVNAYDAWSPAQFDQYIRELALFGVNSIEILPPKTDDQPTSPHMKLPPLEMMVRLSEIIDSYGLDVWIWYPNSYPKMRTNFETGAGVDEELADRESIFKQLKRVDHILVPGGDPGNLQPDVLFPFLDKMATVLNKHHPRAKIWVSPQAFEPTRAWLDAFYRHVNAKPAWLGGAVFAPWCPTSLPEMRAIVDPAIPIRNYPDITHNVDCQYPVRDWDLAFALTLHRECYNPRPLAMKTIHNVFAKYTCGSITYSEGINDDVNKFVWSDQEWDPSTAAVETLRDYCRLFIDPKLSDELAQGFLALERNWEGSLSGNRQVDVTLEQWQQLGRRVSRSVPSGYRFQMGLLRAYYDAYIKRRLIRETELENRTTNVLRTVSGKGSLAVLDEAEQCLGEAQTQPIASDWKRMCEWLADSLFEKIGSQTSVAKHGAQHRTRGAFMDGIDEPLNNCMWLRAQFREVRKLPDEKQRLAAIEQILNRTNPGPGGFYDSLGEPDGNRRLVNDVRWEDDPGTLRSPRITFYYIIDRPEYRDIPLAWKKQACTLYGQPLRMRYDNLDPAATYSVRATYSGRESKLMRLVADERYVVAERIEPRRAIVQEFDIPHAATQDGRLELAWSCGQGQRSTEVAEVWLIKHPRGPDAR